MARHLGIGMAIFLALAACAPRPPVPEAPKQTDLSAEIVTTPDGQAPEGTDNACWATESSPAVIETVTKQEVVTPEERAGDGTVLKPATYRTKTHTRMVSDRQTIWFRAPCPADLTPDFVATLQRALKARGYYLAPLTGTLDEPTVDAIRRFQSERGLASRQLSLAAARDLGLVIASLDQL